jgi:hypothetical protein
MLEQMKNKIIRLSTVEKILYLVILPYTCIDFCLRSLTNDCRIYIGVEYIADHFYPFPQGFDIAWEIKPMANRIMNWILYKWGDAIAGFNNPVNFGIAVKFLMLCIILAVSYFFAKRVNIKYGFLLTFFSLAWVGNFCIGQSEYWAVVFSLLAIALMLSDSILQWICAGTLIPIISLFKGITGLMLIVIVCAVLLLKWGNIPNWKQWLAGTTGIAICGALWLVTCFTIWPHQISDILMSPHLARVGEYPLFDYFMSLFGYVISTMIYIPLFIVAILAAVVYLIYSGKFGGWYTAAFVAMWATTFVIVLCQGEFFIYQYYCMTVPALITIILWERIPKRVKKADKT